MTGATPGLCTGFSEMSGIEHPIVQGGMQWVGRSELVGTVAESGSWAKASALPCMRRWNRWDRVAGRGRGHLKGLIAE